MPVDLSLLQVGDVLWMSRRFGVGNTTMTHRNDYDVVIKAIIPPKSENGWPSYDVVWNGGANLETMSGIAIAKLTPHCPKPERHPWPSRAVDADKVYAEEVANCATLAATSRKVWAERRKAKRAAEKAAAKEKP